MIAYFFSYQLPRIRIYQLSVFLRELPLSLSPLLVLGFTAFNPTYWQSPLFLFPFSLIFVLFCIENNFYQYQLLLFILIKIIPC